MSQSRSVSSRSSSATGTTTRAPSRTLGTPPLPHTLGNTHTMDSVEPTVRQTSKSRASSPNATASSSSRAGLVETLAKQLQLAQDKLERLERQYEQPADGISSSSSLSAPAVPTVKTPSVSALSRRASSTYRTEPATHAPSREMERRTSAFFDRAQDALDDYEATVRDSEDRSLRLLQERLETMEQQWRMRLSTFQEAKETYEAHIADVIQHALAERDGSLQQTAERLKANFDDITREARRARTAVEEQVLQQAEEFRAQYKAILDEDYAERCRALEARMAERERQWSSLLQAEKRKTLESAQAQTQSADEAHLAAMSQALDEVSALRATLLKEHETQEKALLEQFTKAAAEQSEAHQAAIRDCTTRSQRVQRECAETLLEMHRKVEALQAQLAAKDADAARAENADKVAKTEAVFERLSQVRKEVESQWQSVVLGLQEDYEARCSRLTQQHEQRIAQLRASHIEEGKAARRAQDERVAAVEEAAEARWATRLAEAQRASERQMNIVQELRQSQAELTAKLEASVQALEEKEMAHQAALVALTQEHDQAWGNRLAHVRERYDALLQSALHEKQGGVSQAVYEQTVERLHAMEERAVRAQEDLAEQVREAVSQTETLWRQRLRDAEQRGTTYEVQLQARYSALRQQLYQTVSEHEKASSDQAEAERQRTEEEITERLAWERARLEAKHEEALATLEAVSATRLQDRRDALQQQEDLLRAREAALTAKERSLEETVRKRAQEVLEAASVSLQAELDAQWEALREEHVHLDARRALLQQELIAEYEGRFTAAKHQSQRVMADMAKAWLQLQASRQATWETARAEEHALYREALLTQQTQHQRWAHQVLTDAALLMDTMEGRVTERDARLIDAWKDWQAQLMTQTETKAEALATNHTAHMQALATESANQIKVRWQQLEEKLLAQSQQVTATNTALETALRAQYDALLQEERQRSAQTVADVKREAADTLRDARQAWLREADDRLRGLREEAAQVAHQHEAHVRDIALANAKQLEEVRTRYEALLARQRQQGDAREEALVQSFDHLQRQTQESTAQHTQQLRDTYEKKLRAAAERDVQQRADHAQALAQAEAHAARTRDALMHNLEQQYAQSLATLEAALTHKTQELASAEAGVQRRVSEQVMAMEAAMESQYASFVESERQLREADEAAAETRFATRLAEAVEAAKREVRAAVQAELDAAHAQCAALETTLSDLQTRQEHAVSMQPPSLTVPLHSLSPNVYSTALTTTVRNGAGTTAKPLLTVVRAPPSESSMYAPRLATSSHDHNQQLAQEPQQPQQMQSGVPISQWNRVRQLWQVCAVPEADIQSFLERLEKLPIAREQVREVDTEIRRLEAQLPLMELVAKREMLRDTLARQSIARDENSDGYIGDRAAEAERREREMEWRRLTDTLLKELPAFERRHGQLFKYKGERLMDVILAEEEY